MRMQWLTEQLRGGNIEFDEMALNATDPSAFLPSPALSMNRWKSVGVTGTGLCSLE